MDDEIRKDETAMTVEDPDGLPEEEYTELIPEEDRGLFKESPEDDLSTDEWDAEIRKKEKNLLSKGILIGILTVLLPVLAVVGGTACFLRAHNYYISFGTKETETLNTRISLIRKVIDHYFLFDYDEEELDDSALSAYVDSLGDPYTEYYDADEYKALMESSSGAYTGIGVQISKEADTGKIYLTEVFQDSPAQKAGLKAGDRLLRIDDTKVTGLDLDQIVDMIKNSKGSMKITVKRDDKKISVDVACETVTVDTVYSRMLEKNIGYIQLVEFEDVSPDQFQTAVDSLKKQGMKKLVVDLRNNPGGTLNAAVDIADIFVDTGVVVTVKDKYDNEEEYEAEQEGALDMPVVVLVNGDSASASEVLSGCLKDYGLATLVGTKTFGKGIVQSCISLGDGTGLKITTAHYYTPDGNDIHGVGISPDVTVEDDPDTEADEQLEKALEALKDMK